MRFKSSAAWTLLALATMVPILLWAFLAAGEWGLFGQEEVQGVTRVASPDNANGEYLQEGSREEITPLSLEASFSIQVQETGSTLPAIGARVACFGGFTEHNYPSEQALVEAEWKEISESGECELRLNLAPSTPFIVIAARGGVSASRSFASLAAFPESGVRMELPGVGQQLFGTVSGDEIDLSQVEVTLRPKYGRGNELVGRRTSPDSSNGSFFFENCAPGEWLVGFEASGFPTAEYSVIVDAGVNRRVDHRWSFGCTVSLRLVNESGDLVHESYEYALSSVAGSWIKNGVISGGEAVLDRVPVGDAQLLIFPPRTGGGTVDAPVFGRELLSIAREVEEFEIRGQSRSASLAGEVYFGEQKARAGRITATLADGTRVTSDVLTGKFLLESLPIGVVTLRWRLEGLPTFGFQRVEIESPGITRHDVHVPNGTLELRVVDGNGSGIPGCPVRVESASSGVIESGPGVPFYCDPTGALSLSGLPIEQLTVVVGSALMPAGSRPGFETKRISVWPESVRSGTIVEVALGRATQLHMRVVDKHGEPIVGASGFLFDVSGKPISYAAWVASDGDGKLTLPVPPSAPVIVLIRHAEFAPTQRTIVDPQLESVVRVELEKGIPVIFSGQSPEGQFPRLSIRAGSSNISIRQPLAEEMMSITSSASLGLFSGEETVWLKAGWYSAWLSTDQFNSVPVQFQVAGDEAINVQL